MKTDIHAVASLLHQHGLPTCNLSPLCKSERQKTILVSSCARGVYKALNHASHLAWSYACFDYAAAGPYVEIDMNPSGRPGAHIDAIFLSMHKNQCTGSPRRNLNTPQLNTLLLDIDKMVLPAYTSMLARRASL
eukprot:scaffold171280_cov31-Tisochrysis_lutea.AAC.1